jgi:hypothetical protein
VRADSLPWVRASAAALGYELLGPAPVAQGGEAVVLRPTRSGAPIALVARLDKRSGTLIEVPLGSGETLRSLALRFGERLQADAVLVGLDPERGALGNAAFVEAHAAASFSASNPAPSVVVVRAGAIGAGEAHAEVASWGGDAGAALAERCSALLAELGMRAVPGALDLAAREQAGRSVFGRTPLVSITLDPRRLPGSLSNRAQLALDAFAEFPVADEECGVVALELARDLSSAAQPAPATLIESARRAALERSIVARRSLQAALAATAAKAEIARASEGIFLVVVGRQAHALVAGAFPLALAAPRDRLPSIGAQTLAGCEQVLDQGGVCSVTEAR